MQTELFDHAVRGDWWEPENRPEIPATLIRDLVVTAEADGRHAHPKGVRVRGVKIAGVLDFEYATLTVPLLLRDVDIDEPINLQQAQGSSVSITDSRLAGVSAFQMHLKHSLVLSGSIINGPVTLLDATIGGRLKCDGATFRNPDGDALSADWIRVGGAVFLNDQFQAEGTVWFVGATIGGQLTCSGATFRNPDGDALIADGMQVGGSVFLNDQFQANGAVRLVSAAIGGQLACNGGTFNNPDGDAISADGIQVDGSMFLNNQFRADGTVRLVGAAIGGQLACNGGTFNNPDGVALSADGMQVIGSVFLNDQFQADGTVWLLGATIGDNLDCSRSTIRNPNGDALVGRGLSVLNEMLWYDLSDVKGTLKLEGAHLLVLADDPQSWQFADMDYSLQGLRIDHFVGTGADWTWQERRDWLDEAIPSGPGPYEMVAQWYRNVGKDHEARQIGIAKQDVRAATLAVWRKPFHWLWRQLAAYGYQPWRALILFLAFYGAGVVVFGRLSEMILARTPDVYSFNAWVYTADVIIPLVDLRQAGQWAPANTLGLLTMWTLIVAGWVLSIALVAAVSGLFTKD